MVCVCVHPREKDMRIQSERAREMDTQTCRQAGGHADRQASREADRQASRGRQREREIEYHTKHVNKGPGERVDRRRRVFAQTGQGWKRGGDVGK